MGFFSNFVSSVVKVSLSPIAVVKDAIEVATGGEANNTKELLKSAKEDGDESLDNLSEGEL